MDTKSKKDIISTPYSLPTEEVLAQLRTSSSGISDEEASVRLKQSGLNILTQKKKHLARSILLNQFKNSLTLILFGAVGLILFVYFFGEKQQSDLIEAGLIFAIILMITILGFFQEYKAEKALDSLKMLLAFKAKVKRNGEEKEIDVAKIVPGDIIIIEEGLKVPADIRLLETFSLYANESSLTGESTTVEKHGKVLHENVQIAEQANMLFAGTIVTAGRAFGVVVRTSDTTEIGKIANLVASEPDIVSPIQKRLDKIGKMLGYLVISISSIVFVFIAFFVREYAALPILQKIIYSFIAAVALAVAAIPEGLPAVVTISLAIGTQRMAKKNALVRKLSSVETLGSVDVICSDKTGTLTKNEMTVTEVYSAGKIYHVTGAGYETNGRITFHGQAIDKKDLALLFDAGLFCNNASLHDYGNIGDPTEIALLVSAKKANVTLDGERIQEIPFNSERKMMSVVIKKNDGYLLFAKGAPEVMLNKSVDIQMKEKRQAITFQDKTAINEIVHDMNARALRTLGFAYKVLSAKDLVDKKLSESFFEEDLTFLGLQAMMDPAREEVKPLISQCKQSGIRVVMITGDHEATASAIAAAVGIEGETVTGMQVDQMSKEEFLHAVERISVYARVNPDTKMRIVEALQHNGHIVAMTGDGVNDAPALKKADIGIAMGISGTDVAKEASDIVLLDDMFSTIVSAIEEGRGIFQNIRKFVHYLLACNLGEVMVVFFGVIIFRELPLTATMLLWINVVTDGLPALALGMDKVHKHVLALSPKEFQGDILTKKVWISMIIFAIILTVATLGIYYINISEHITEAKGAAFIAIAFFELVYLFIIRSSYNTSLFSNKWLIWAVYFTVIAQIAIVYVPFLANLFEIRHIDFIDWVYIISVSIVLWIGFKLIKKPLII